MVNEVEEIQRRAGISQNWDRDKVSRLLKQADDALSHAGNEVTGIEDESQRAELLDTIGECAKRLRSIRRRLHLFR